MNDREFWIQIRRGLIVMLDAIDQRFALNTVRPADPASFLKGTPAQSTQEGMSANGIRNR